MAQVQDTSNIQGLGHPLHVRASKLLEDFLKGAEEHFQYLQEILAEAKEHFVRRESLELLPKTPCMKRKRKRTVKSPKCSPILASSPLQARSSIDDVCKTPDSKKPTTRKETPTKTGEVEIGSTSSDGNTRQVKINSKVSKSKKPSKGTQRKQPRRNAKKASASDETSTIKEERTAATPKRMTRSKRKEAENNTAVLEIGNINKKNKVQEVNAERENLKDHIKEATPRQLTRNKRKDSEKETVAANHSEILKKKVCQQYTPSPQAKRTKSDQECIGNTPQNAEVFIPETPQVQQKTNEASTTNNKDDKAVRTSIKFTMAPTIQNEQTVYAEKQDLPSRDVVIVEAKVYENEENAIATSTPEKDMEAPISEPTVSSTKKLKRETRSSVKGTKRKQNSVKAQGKKLKISFPTPHESSALEVNSQQTTNEPTNSDSDAAVVSSTVNTSPKPQRRSFRPLRGTRRSSRLSIQANKSMRISKARKSKSLVKSSVTLKLSAKKMMPSLEKSLEDETNLESSSEFAKENVTKQLLFEESNINKKDTESDPETLQEEDSPRKQVMDKENKVKADDVAVADPGTEFHEPGNINNNVVNNDIDFDIKDDADIKDNDDNKADETNKSIDETNNNKDDADNKDDIYEEVFHDVPDSSEEEEFHDASERVDHVNVNCEIIDVAATSGPVTRSSSRNQSSGSSRSSGEGSASSRETQLLSPCKQTGEELNHTQSSPEPSQEHCVPVEDGCCDEKMEEHDQNLFGFENKVLKNHAGVIHSFIRRNTPKKADRQEKSRMIKLAIKEKEEKEKERLERLAIEKQKKIEDQKRRREEKERKVAGIRAVKIREQKEKKEQLEKKLEMRRALEEKAKKVREKEEEAKRKARQEKAAEIEARRKLDEEQRKQKRREKEEEERRHQEMMQRKAEFEEQERQRKIMEAKQHQEHREAELHREKIRIKKEMEEKERQAKEEREKQEKKSKQEKERQEKKLREEKEREERERKRIAALLKEKEEQDRKERELKAREEKLRKEREIKFRIQEEAERERERLRKLQEQREREEARLRALRDVTSYDMTPPPPPRVRSVATTENYNIDDICSDDSTDDEDAPKKKIPQWAQGANLKAILINQSAMKIDDIEAIFGGVPMPNLDEIFTQKKRKRFYQRTSSAHWDSPPLKTLNRGTLI